MRGATYNALGKPTAYPLGNGLTTTLKYYGIDYLVSGAPYRWYGLPYQIQTGSAQNQTNAVFDGLGNLTAGYDLVGNPEGISYADNTGEELTLAYNELNQLTSVSGNLSETIAYDQTNPGPYTTYNVGNIVSKGSVSYSYPLPGGTRPDTPLTTTTGGTYSYDANGNRTGDSSYTYAYDVENHLTGIETDVAPILSNAYDGDGVRVHQDGGTLGSPVTHFVGPWYEHDTLTGVATVYCPFNGVPVAMKEGSTLSYLHHDHLGSLVAATDTSGNELGWMRCNPFGERRLSGGTLPTNRLFTGQPRDLMDDRLYFFQSRYYDSTIGKFFQADTASPHWANPQSLNPYAYALDNPMRLVDPSGHYSEHLINRMVHRCG